LVKGFAVGRTIFNTAADGWLAGRITDEQAVADMAQRFASLVETWNGVQHQRAV
jgi:5-dehydro-2-deoxygluconokinase